ncbi:MAG TPA: class I SAM-dependent methyltransferase [Gemmatimonadales bacterium]|nr:class I SAM-dependent methyltransferase [Gemmatimonadales bacterium]
MPLSPVTRCPRPSTWFFWQAHFLHPGGRVLDLACGEGRHALAAAALGSQALGVDRDAEKLAMARELATLRGLRAEFECVDLEAGWPAFGTFDAVLVFNYLDRARMPQIVHCVAPGGVLIMETFLDAQLQLGWGPTDPAHLLRPGELSDLARPLDVIHGREVLEPVDAERWRAVASVVARRHQ